MTNMITAAIVATAILTATVSNAGSYEFCQKYSEMVGNMAQARDLGVPASVVYEMAIESNLPLDTMVELIQMVYIDGLVFSPEGLKSFALTACLK